MRLQDLAVAEASLDAAQLPAAALSSQAAVVLQTLLLVQALALLLLLSRGAEHLPVASAAVEVVQVGPGAVHQAAVQLVLQQRQLLLLLLTHLPASG
jgi:hypothetical protein